MKKTVMGMMLALLCAAAPVGMARAAGQETTAPPAGTPQPVHDEEVFGKTRQLVEESVKVTKAVTDMDATLRNALTRKRQMGKLADMKDVRILIPTDKETNAEIDEIYKQVEKLRCARFTNSEQLTLCKKVEMSTVTLVKMLRDNLERSQTRGEKIQSLLAELDKLGPSNLTETADLLNRIQVEIALLQNDKTMVDMAIAKNDQQVRLYNKLLIALAKDGPGNPDGNFFGIGGKAW